MKKKIETSSLKAIIMGLMSVLLFMLFDYLFSNSKAPQDPNIQYVYYIVFGIGYCESLVSQVVKQLNESEVTEKENEE
jgi:hypothetical protein